MKLGSKNTVNTLEKLKAVQSEIKDLEKSVEKPSLKPYTESTRTFPGGNAEVLKYIQDIIEGTADPLYPPKTTHGLVGGNCIYMWECFSEYFKELADYCKNKDKNLARLDQLRIAEAELKAKLGIN